MNQMNLIDNVPKQFGKSIKLSLQYVHLSPKISFDLHMHDPLELQVVEFDPLCAVMAGLGLSQ